MFGAPVRGAVLPGRHIHRPTGEAVYDSAGWTGTTSRGQDGDCINALLAPAGLKVPPRSEVVGSPLRAYFLAAFTPALTSRKT
jgi:hypothetical protein